MNKEFTQYEEALALKELGYYDSVFGQWWEDKNDGEKFLFTGNDISEEYEQHDIRYICEAPLYQQAFRWFREKHGLDSFVKHLYKSTIKVGYYFGIDKYKGVEFQMDFDAWYKTYEEAELECLKKLIEIVKR